MTNKELLRFAEYLKNTDVWYQSSFKYELFHNKQFPVAYQQYITIFEKLWMAMGDEDLSTYNGN